MSGQDDSFSTDFFVSGEERQSHPMRAAQAALKPQLPKRFYKQAAFEAHDDAFCLMLDGRLAKTPGRKPLALATKEAAALLVMEWKAQATDINPALMPVTRMANAAIDHVATAMDEVAADCLKYIESDLVCYRAGEPAALVEKQNAVWNPVIDWFEERVGVRLLLSEGIRFVPQDERLKPAVARWVYEINDPAALAALHVMTTISGSLVLALAAAEIRLSAEAAYDAAELDADFETDVWGHDEEAAQRRAGRLKDFLAANALFQAMKARA
jgi:chaperone required for assembly of F1-ATPase